MSHNAKVLFVEDDIKLAKFVVEYLQRNQFTVDWVTNGSEVMRKLKTEQYCLVLLDVMLPGKSGFDICREMREIFQGAIIMLTARTNDFDHIRGLECGADDYLYKPIEPLVLLARMNMHLRRRPPVDKPKTELTELEFGNLKIDLKSHFVYLDEELLCLTEGEFSLLQVLAMNHGEVMTRASLFELAIGRQYDGLDRTVDGRISRIRKKLKCSQDDPRFIKPIRSQGYLFFAKPTGAHD